MSRSHLSFFLLVLVSVCGLLLLQSHSVFGNPANPNTNNSNLYASALTLQVEPREEACFYEDLESGKTFRLEFEVVRGGLLDIKVKIFDPQQNTVLDKMAFFNRNDDALNEQEGRISFQAGVSGTYKLCFDNTMSRWTAKVVSFFVMHDQPKDPHGDVAKLEHLGPMVDSVIKIADQLDVIENAQHHMRVREQSARDSIEQTHSRVHWVSLIDSLLLIGMTAFQLYYIRHWFAETSTRGRV